MISTFLALDGITKHETHPRTGPHRFPSFVANISIRYCRTTITRSGWNWFRQILCSGLRLLRWCCVSHYPFVALAAMHSGVACRAQRDQVFL